MQLTNTSLWRPFLTFKHFKTASYRGRWQGQRVAVKRLKHSAKPNELRHEVRTLGKLRHPNVAYFYGSTPPPDPLLVSELLWGSLYELLHGGKHKHGTLLLALLLLPLLLLLKCALFHAHESEFVLYYAVQACFSVCEVGVRVVLYVCMCNQCSSTVCCCGFNHCCSVGSAS
jgi:serine/threonine protein kinase